jgi:methionine sulfoxide reductase heme-binding subunit
MAALTSHTISGVAFEASAALHFARSVMSSSAISVTGAASTANPFFWYVTRAAAVSSYLVLTLVVLLGISRSLVRISGSHASWVLDEIHQFLALLVAALVSLHLLSLFLDPLIPFSLLNFALPIAEPYRPLAVDLGVLSLYGLVIVLLSSWLRRYIKHTTWRTLHYISFVVFLLVTLHGVLAGSDSGQPWMIVVYLLASLAVGLMTLIRVLWTPAHAPYPAGPAPHSR